MSSICFFFDNVSVYLRFITFSVMPLTELGHGSDKKSKRLRGPMEPWKSRRMGERYYLTDDVGVLMTHFEGVKDPRTNRRYRLHKLISWF